jgi:ribonuclease H2 subunit A
MLPTKSKASEYLESGKVECCLGIDEAGRGPVLGPMVYGAAYWPTSCEQEMADLGFDDSKVLSEETRERMFGEIESLSERVGFRLRILTPEEMSGGMLRQVKYNLNAISHDAAIELIREVLESGVNLTHVYVDTVGPPETYESKLQHLFPRIKVAVRKKADSLFPVVSAASICAKVVRDRSLRHWEFREHLTDVSRHFGSGYPGDPNTKRWLKEHRDDVFGYPSLIRFSWKTSKRIMQQLCTPVRYGTDEDFEKVDGGPQSKRQRRASYGASDSDSDSDSDASSNDDAQQQSLAEMWGKSSSSSSSPSSSARLTASQRRRRRRRERRARTSSRFHYFATRNMERIDDF